MSKFISVTSGRFSQTSLSVSQLYPAVLKKRGYLTYPTRDLEIS